MTTISVFDAALDACMAYMSDRGAHLFDPPTEECPARKTVMSTCDAANSFGI